MNNKKGNMKIHMSKRKSGIYAQWYVVIGLNPLGERCNFLIFYHQANTYAQAVKFWNKTWGEKCKAFYLINAEPFSDSMAQAC